MSFIYFFIIQYMYMHDNHISQLPIVQGINKDWFDNWVALILHYAIQIILQLLILMEVCDKHF